MRAMQMWKAYLCFLLGAALVASGESTFTFDALRLAPYTASYLGNGLMGCETAPLGTTPTRCFLAGVYDHTAGDVPRIASIAAWNEMDLFNGERWLNAGGALPKLESYRQTLDMYDGTLHSTYRWRERHRALQITAEEFVSRADAHLAAVRFTIVPEFAGTVRVKLPLRNWPPPRRYGLERMQKLDDAAQKNPWLIWYPGHLTVSNVQASASAGQGLLSLAARSPGYATEIGEAVALAWSSSAHVELSRDGQGAVALLALNVQPGVRYTFTKYAATIVGTYGGRPQERARQAALSARRAGWQALLTANASAWHKLWESDIVVEGDPKLQRAIHSMLYYLLAAARAESSLSVPPMGLSNAGYYGHIFWDADTFVFPALLLLHPEIAHSLVEFRSRTIEAARRNASRNSFQGAMYPWEADPEGVEATPRFAGQNASYENHINGDIALAAWQYWLATGDHRWLEHDCWPILRDTADFWSSRVTFNAKRDRYEIGNVVAVNESLVGVSNDPYTNAIARKNLELAGAAARELKKEPHPKWREIAAKMYVPESDSALLWFPLDLPFTTRQTQQALDHMLAEVQRGELGAMMGGEFYPILAAQLGERKLIGQLLPPLWQPYLRPPFNVIAETPSNRNMNFVTGAGAFLQQFVFGYTGLRLGEHGLETKYRPVLPPGVHRLTLQNIPLRGKRQRLSFSSQP